MRGLKDIKTARLFTDGWLFYYNYLRPHESLDDRTPAKEAGLKIPFRNWLDVVSNKRTITPSQTSVTSVFKVPELPKVKHVKRQTRTLVKKRKRYNPMPTLSQIRR